MSDVLARVRALVEAGLESETSDRQYALEAILRALDGAREQMASETREALDVALADSAAGLTVDLGDFAQYVDEASPSPLVAVRARLAGHLADTEGAESEWHGGFRAGIRVAVNTVDEEFEFRVASAPVQVWTPVEEEGQ